MRTKWNRALTCLLVAVMVIGSIHLVAADNREYDAPNLVLEQGQPDVDLLQEISYNQDRYTLAVTDEGGFNINEPGRYQVSYTLTPKVTQGAENGDQNVGDAGNTDQGGENQDTNTTIPEQGQPDDSQNSSDNQGNTGDSKEDHAGQEESGSEGSDGAGSTESDGTNDDAGTSTEGSPKSDSEADAQGTDDTAAQSLTTNEAAAAQSVDTQTAAIPAVTATGNADSDNNPKNENDGTSNEVSGGNGGEALQVIEFRRWVIVQAAEKENEIALYSQGDYTVNLGTPVWTDEKHTKFQYTNAKVDVPQGDTISLMTITLSNGTLPQSILNDANFTDYTKRSATWLFENNTSGEYIQEKIRNMIFDYVDDKMNVYVSIDGNPNVGLDTLPQATKLTQWAVNGNYYLITFDKASWAASYNKAKTYKLGGKKGYLATIDTQEQASYLASLLSGSGSTGAWTSGTRTVDAWGQKFNDTDQIGDVSTAGESIYEFYWACGPEVQTPIATELWAPGEPIRDGNVHAAIEPGMNYKLNDDNNVYGDIVKRYFIVEFGGYADGQDPGHPDESKKGSQNVLVAPADAEAQIGDVIYARLADALTIAEAGQTVKIISPAVTVCTDAELKDTITIQDHNGHTYLAKDGNVTIDVNAGGEITLVNGKLELSVKAPLKVFSPVDSQTYSTIAPNCSAEAVVDKTDTAKAPYITGAQDGVVQIGNVKYTYTNQAPDKTQVQIPDAMVDNLNVIKAEIQAEQTGTVKVDAAESVVFKGGGSDRDTAVVTRRAADNRAEVTLPQGINANVFGHEITGVSAGNTKVSQSDPTNNTEYPNRAYVTLNQANDSITADGYTYQATTTMKTFFLGAFKVSIDETGLIINDGDGVKPAHYQENYKIKLKLKPNYAFDTSKISVTMDESEQVNAGKNTYTGISSQIVESWNASDGILELSIPKVTGAITITTGVSHLETTLHLTGLTKSGGKCIVKLPTGAQEVTADGEIKVNRNEPLELTFVSQTFENSYYEAISGEAGSSFYLLTALTEGTDGNTTDKLTDATFNWKAKSYTLTYTPTEEAHTLNASFQKSHVFRVFMTGGTVDVTKTDDTTTGLLHRDHDAETGEDSHHIIVPEGTELKVTMKKKDGVTEGFFKAFWSAVENDKQGTRNQIADTDISKKGDAYVYTTPAIKSAYILEASFEQKQQLELKVVNGIPHSQLPDSYNPDAADKSRKTLTWKPGADNSYTSTIDYGDSAYIVVKANDDSYQIKSLTVDGASVDVAAEIAAGNVIKTNDNYYIYKTLPIQRAYTAEVVFEQKHKVTFQGIKKNITGGVQTIVDEVIEVFHGDKIPSDQLDKMVDKAVEATGNVTKNAFFAWIDNTTGKIFTKSMQVLSELVLKPLFRSSDSNIVHGEEGSSIAADHFTITEESLASLSDDQAKQIANVAAYSKEGNAIGLAQIKVTGLAALQGKGAGTHQNALTFSIGADGLVVSVNVTVVQNHKLIVLGKTAHTITFQGESRQTYTIRESANEQRQQMVTVEASGIGTAAGLTKDTEYLIFNDALGRTTARTSLVDAQDIAEQFKDANDTTGTHSGTGKDEVAANQNVKVTVDESGNYKVTLKKNIDHTVEVPDIWEDVTIDMAGHTIKGADADANSAAQPGLLFKKDETAKRNPGTNLTVINGTIQGGSGSAAHPNGAPAVSTAKAEGATGAPKDASIDVGNGAKLLGGQGANAVKNSGDDGGDGGSGITGSIETYVNGGTVKGGDAGDGADVDTEDGNPGNGGKGGAGISTSKNITINSGSVIGGKGGKGGKSLGENKKPGGAGGGGGNATEGGGDNNNNGGNVSGGAGGDGGSSEKGDGGVGGAGGNTGITGGTGGTENGGNGGDGGQGQKPGAGGDGGTDSSGNNNGNAGKPGGSGSGNTGGSGSTGGGTTTKPGGSTSGGSTGGSTTKPGGTTTKPGDTTTKPGGTTTKPGGSTGGGNNGGTTTKPGGNNNQGGNTKPGGNDNQGGNFGSNDNNGNNSGNHNGTNTGGNGSQGNGSGNGANQNGGTSDGSGANGIADGNNDGNGSDHINGDDASQDNGIVPAGSDNVSDNTNGNMDADGSADGSEVGFWQCSYHWSPIILMLVLAGYAVLRILEISSILKRKDQ